MINALFAFISLILFSMHPTLAATNSRKADVKAGMKAGMNKSTKVNFDDAVVEGRYHFANEAVTTVEGEKVVDALLNVRPDFKDRMKQSAARH